MYTRKHHKRTVCQGDHPQMERYLCHDDKGGEIYQMQRTEAWFQVEQIYQMQRIEAWFQGSRFIRCKGMRHGSRGRRFIRWRGKRHGSRGIMSDMISVLHQSVSINAKGWDCWLRLVVIDGNPWRKPRSTKVWVIDPILFDVNMTHYCFFMVDKK